MSDIDPGDDDTEIILTIASIAASDETGITVVYTAGGNGTVQDLSGNLLATNAGVESPTW